MGDRLLSNVTLGHRLNLYVPDRPLLYFIQFAARHSILNELILELFDELKLLLHVRLFDFILGILLFFLFPQEFDLISEALQLAFDFLLHVVVAEFFRVVADGSLLCVNFTL